MLYKDLEYYYIIVSYTLSSKVLCFILMVINPQLKVRIPALAGVARPLSHHLILLIIIPSRDEFKIK